MEAIRSTPLEEIEALDQKYVEMLRYAEELTRSPGDVTEQAVQSLREAGFDDEEILWINMVTSYFNMMNRIADGLGVELDPEYESSQPD